MDTLRIMKGDQVLLRYQLLEDGRPRDISGMKFILDMKKSFHPGFHVHGFIEDAGKGKFSFLIKETNETLSGVMEIKMLDRKGRALTLTPPGGIPVEIIESPDEIIENGKSAKPETGDMHGVLL